MPKHTFKVGHYYMRVRDGLLYKVVPCNCGEDVHAVLVGECRDCPYKTMLSVVEGGKVASRGYCVVSGVHSTYIKRLTKLELLLHLY